MKNMKPNTSEQLPDCLKLFRDEHIICVTKLSMANWALSIVVLSIPIFLISCFVFAFSQPSFHKGSIFDLNPNNLTFSLILVTYFTIYFHNYYFEVKKWRTILTNKRLVIIEKGVFVTDNN